MSHGTGCTKHGYTNNVYCPMCDKEALTSNVSADRLTDLLASCVFQSETGGHADEYVAFLCDLASVCMELQKRRAADEPPALRLIAERIRDHACSYGAPADSVLVKRELIGQLAQVLGGSISQPPRAINCGNCQTPDYCNNIRGLCAHAPVSALTKQAHNVCSECGWEVSGGSHGDDCSKRIAVETSACTHCGERHEHYNGACPRLAGRF